jgi:hypothetical protein
MGPLASLDYYWYGLRGDINEIDSTGQEDLNMLRQKKKESKPKESKWGTG